MNSSGIRISAKSCGISPDNSLQQAQSCSFVPSSVCSGLFWVLLFCGRSWRLPDAAGGALNPLLCLQRSWRCSVHLILPALSWFHRTDNPLFWDHSAKDMLSSLVAMAGSKPLPCQENHCNNSKEENLFSLHQL